LASILALENFLNHLQQTHFQRKFGSEMKKRSIKTHLGHKLKAFESDKVITEKGEISADLILFMPNKTPT
jgi:NADH dehydrogenase FAD-containing subunit